MDCSARSCRRTEELQYEVGDRGDVVPTSSCRAVVGSTCRTLQPAWPVRAAAAAPTATHPSPRSTPTAECTPLHTCQRTGRRGRRSHPERLRATPHLARELMTWNLGWSP